MNTYLKKIINKRTNAFSLLEIAIGLAITGVLTMAVLKGQQMLHNARLDKTASQIEALRINIETFRTTYGALPGDYKGHAIDDITQGNGDGIIGDGTIDGSEEKNFFQHLIAAGLMTHKQTIPSIGGYFSVKYNAGDDMPGHWLILSGPNKNGLETGLLTSKDAVALKLKIDGNEDNATGIVRVRGCVDGSGNIVQSKKKTCTIYIEFP